MSEVSELKLCPLCGSSGIKEDGNFSCCSNINCPLHWATIKTIEWQTRPIEDKLELDIKLLTYGLLKEKVEK